MSDRAIYPTRLWWSGGKGVARHDGVEVQLHERPPVLLALGEVEQLDYAPGPGLYLVQQRGERTRDMTTVERDEIRQRLDRMAAAARRDWTAPWR